MAINPITNSPNESGSVTLTPEEERQRAIKLSSLYPQRSSDGRSFLHKIEVMDTREIAPIDWSELIKVAMVVPLPFVLLDIMFRGLLIGPLSSILNTPAALVILVPYLVVMLLFMRIIHRYFNGQLANILINSNFIFWVTTFFAIPSILVVRYFFVKYLGDTPFWLIGTLLYVFSAAAISSGVVALLVYITKVVPASERSRMRLVVMVAVTPYIVTLLLGLMGLL